MNLDMPWPMIDAKCAYGLELSGVDIDADAINANESLDFRFVDDVLKWTRISGPPAKLENGRSVC
jgi:hypothetical protein